MGCYLDVSGPGTCQPATKDRLYDSIVRGEFSLLYSRVEGTKVDPLVG